MYEVGQRCAATLPNDYPSCTLKMTRFEQPAFTSQSVYQHIKYDLSWKHEFSDKLARGCGLHGLQLRVAGSRAARCPHEWIPYRS